MGQFGQEAVIRGGKIRWASKIKSELGRMDLKSAGTQRNLGTLLGKEATLGHLNTAGKGAECRRRGGWKGGGGMALGGSSGQTA